MRVIRSLFYSLLILQFLFGSLVLPASAAQGGSNTPVNTASLDVKVEAAQTEIAKPANAPAQGKLNITLLPQGTATETSRQPVDVVFVFDRSLSMLEKAGNKTKLSLAQSALGEAVKLFQTVNSGKTNIGDRFALVPFSSENESLHSPTYPLTTDLKSIYNHANALSAAGFTNYTVALKNAKELVKDSNRKKYIIFLTDGMPTVSQKVMSVGGTQRTVYYEFFTSWWFDKYYFDQNGKKRDLDDSSSQEIKQEIYQHGLEQATELSQQNIKLYSIGFGDKDGPTKEVDLEYLESLSAITGATAQHGRADNLNSVFRAVTDEINRLVLGEVELRVRISDQQLKDRVRLAPGANAYMDGDYAVIKMNDVPYTIGGATPSPQSYTLPLEFLETGNYVFNDITLTYKQFNGQKAEVKNIHPVHIKVRDTVEPTFQGTMSFSKDVTELVKSVQSDLNNNTFDIRYTITPTGDLAGKNTGMLSNVKLVQYLPKGITVVNQGPFVKTTEEANGTRVEISFDPVRYNKQGFTPATPQERVLSLTVNHALNERIQNAELTYVDNEEKKITMEAPKDPVHVKVKLRDSRGFLYEGNETGQIRKVMSADNSLIDSVLLQLDGEKVTLPVKTIDFKPSSNNNRVVVTYRDTLEERDETAEFSVVPLLIMNEKESGREIRNQSWSRDTVVVTLQELIPDSGSNVSYEYRIKKNNTTGNWTKLEAPYTIELPEDGSYTVDVKATGGFAVGATTSTSVLIDKTLPEITITSPANNAVIDGDTVQITGRVTESNLEWLKLTQENGNTTNQPIQVNADGTFTYTATLAEGTNTFTFTASDEAGNQNSVTITVIKSDGTTKFSLYEDPNGNQPVPEEEYIAWHNRTLYAKLEFPPSFGPGDKTYFLNGSSKIPYNDQLIAIETEGVNTLSYKLRVTDAAPVTKTVKIDKTKPEKPTIGGTIENGFIRNLTMSATDSGSGMDHIEYWTSINPERVTYPGTPFDLPLPAVVPEDRIIVYAKSYDHAGNASEIAEKVFTLDTQPPVIEIPREGFIKQHDGSHGEIDLDVTVTDSGTGVDETQVTYTIFRVDESGHPIKQVADGNLVNSGGNSYSAKNVTFKDEQENIPGVYKVLITAKDKVGNETIETQLNADYYMISPGYTLSHQPVAVDSLNANKLLTKVTKGKTVSFSHAPVKIKLLQNGGSYFKIHEKAQEHWDLFNKWSTLRGLFGSLKNFDLKVAKVEYKITELDKNDENLGVLREYNWAPLKEAGFVIMKDGMYRISFQITDNYTMWGAKRVTNVFEFDQIIEIDSKLKRF
jgi:hypothetical protein